MIRLKLKVNISIICGLCLFFLGCVHSFNFWQDTSKETNSQLVADKYSEEIARQHKIVQENPESSKTMNAHLKLARLYSSYKNPRRNYKKALEQLEMYVSLGEFTRDDNTQNWLAALREIDHLAKQIRKGRIRLKRSKKEKLALKESNKKLTREEIKLRERNRKLEEDNLKLQKKIEMLKNLDRRLEEKRKNFNN